MKFAHFTGPARRTFQFSALTAALWLAGCTVGPDFVRPDAPAGQQITRTPVVTTASAPMPSGAAQRFESAAEVKREWWTLFESPVLNDLVARALAENPTIEAAQASLRQAQALVSAQRGFYFPTIGVGYEPTRQGNSNTISPTLNSGETPFTLNTAQVSVGFTPDVFGLNRRTVESLQAQAQTQKFLLDAANVTLATNVVTAAVQQAALRSQIKSTEEIIRAANRALDILKAQAKIGYSSALDVAAQETLLAQAQQTLPPLHKQLEQTRNQLAVLAGKLPAQGGLENFDIDALRLPESLPLSLPSQIVEQRPDVRAAEEQLHAASALVGVAIANRLPQFSITAVLGGAAVPFSQMFTSDNQFWGITGSITQTIFDFGTLKYRQDAAKAGLDQAGAQYRSTVLTAFQNVADTLYALDADARSLAAAANAERAARRTLDLTEQQLRIGSVNVLALLLAQQAYHQAVISRIQAQASRLMNTAALFQSLGGGWNNPPQVTDATPRVADSAGAPATPGAGTAAGAVNTAAPQPVVKP